MVFYFFDISHSLTCHAECILFLSLQSNTAPASVLFSDTDTFLMGYSIYWIIYHLIIAVYALIALAYSNCINEFQIGR